MSKCLLRKRHVSKNDRIIKEEKQERSVIYTTSSEVSHPVQIGVRIFWHVVVEDDVDSLDVHPSAKEVGCHQDPPLEVLELLIARQSGGESGGKRVRRGRREQIIYTAAVGITELHPL